MLEQFQPWIDYGKLIESQANEENFTVGPEDKKPKVKTKPYQTKRVTVVRKIGRK